MGYDMKNAVNIMNFVRALDPRVPVETLTEAVREELRLVKRYGFENTMLVQYDALINEEFVSIFREEADEKTEFGVWIELCRPLTEKVGIPWRGREGYDWDWYVDPGFLMAYTTDERRALVDEVMRKFREVFGYYPESVGSWLLDAYSMEYMSEKYGIKAFGICREQYNIDAYSLWGGYYNQAYYPSRNNMLCPAKTDGMKINTPVFRLLGPDPIYNYNDSHDGAPYGGCPTLEPVWRSGQIPEVIDWYFRCYFEKENLGFGYAQLGQENSFGWRDISRGLPMQMEKLKKAADCGLVTVEKMRDTGKWFSDTYQTTPPSALTADEDWTGNGLKAVWYDSVNYRAGLLVKNGVLRFRDIFKFDEKYPERYLETPCRDWKATYDNLPVVEGKLWGGDDFDSGLYFDGDVRGFEVHGNDGVLTVDVSFSDGERVCVVMSQEKITVKTSSPLTFRWKKGWDTELKIGRNSLDFVHNGYSYSVPVNGEIDETEDGYRIAPVNGVITLSLD